MALSGWNADNKIRLTIPAQASALTNFPVLVNLESASGVTSLDTTAVFDELTPLDVDDDFTGSNGDAPDSIVWEVDNNSATGSAEINANKCRITIPSTSSDEYIGVRSNFLLSGDFDIQIDYAEISNDQPSSSTTYPANFWATSPDTPSFFLLAGTTLSSAGTHYMSANSPAMGYNTCTPHYPSGKIRLTRSGSVIKFFYWTGSQWEWDGSTSGLTFDDVMSDDLVISLFTSGDYDSGATTDYDNFTINSGTVVWPETPKRLAVEIGDTGTQCYVEIERWDATNESAQLHVKVPSISDSVSTVINLYYDASQADNTTYVGDTSDTPAQSVWDAYFDAVYHMAQDPSGGSDCILDSTSNANHGTPAGSMTSGDLVEGLVGLAIDLDGSDDYIQCGYIEASAAAFTVEALATTTDQGANTLVSDLNSGDNYKGFELKIYANGTKYSGGAFGLAVDSWSGSADQVFASEQCADGAWYCMAFTADAQDCSLYIDGSEDSAYTDPSTLSSNDIDSSLDVHIGSRPGASDLFAGKIGEVRISNIARSADWLAATNNSLRDNLITFAWAISGSSGASGSGGASYEVIRKIIELDYALTSPFVKIIELLYSSQLAKIIELIYGDATVARKVVNIPYGNAIYIVKIVRLRYGNYANLRKIIDLVYDLYGDIRKIIDLKYHITEEELIKIISLKYDLSVYDEFRKIINLVYGIVSGVAIEETTTVSVSTPTETLDPFHINIEKEEGRGFDVSLKTYRESDYEACVPGTVITVTINADTYTVVVEERGITREMPRKIYEIACRSQLYLLDAPYADTVSQEFSGMASSIVESLVDLEITASVTWTMIDWYIPASTLIASDQTPLNIIKKIVDAGGGVVEADKDGNMICRPKYPVNIPDYETETPDVYLTDEDDFYTVSSNVAWRPGFNNYFISNQSSETGGLSIETEEISSTQKAVKVFQTPWEGDEIRLNTSGGDHVTIAYDGIVQELIEDEVVEIIDGSGSTQNPIYEEVSAVYSEDDLGAITTGEDGSISTAIEENSLILFTYRTIYHKFTVTDLQIESVQFWPEIL